MLRVKRVPVLDLIEVFVQLGLNIEIPYSNLANRYTCIPKFNFP